jgi:tetratricopeptide (TPR) repeat protein
MAQAKRRVPPLDINVAIRLFEQGDVAGSARLCRKALASNPKALPERIVLAGALLANRETEDALTEADAVLARDPSVAAAHFIRGSALLELRRHAEAAEALHRAVERAPHDAKSWLNFGIALTELDRVEAATDALRRACSLAPQSADAFASLGAALVRGPRLPEAVAAYRTALRLLPDFAPAAWDLGFALLLGGDYASGWAAMKQRKPEEDAAIAASGVTGAEWEGTTDLAGDALLVVATQGLGDTIQFARYLPLLAAQNIRVMLSCDARLAPLLKTMPGVVAVVTPADPPPAHAAWVAMSSLPRLFATTQHTTPTPAGYLRAEPQRVAHWRAALAPGGLAGPPPGAPPSANIGLVWAGNPAHQNDRRRSMPVAALGPLLTLPGIRFLGLQRGAAALPDGITDLGPHLTDFAEAAAIVGALDLVITVDTAMAHLAGALARPVWVALPHAPDWRWMLNRDGSPWYRSARLFRQPRPGDWASVVAAIASALATSREGALK